MRGWITLAIVVVVLGFLGGSLLVCILMVREAAVAMQCSNNLKQIALALHNYHDVNDRLPMATEPHASLPPEKRLSWMPALLPYMECMGGRVLLDPNEAWDGETNRVPLFEESVKDEDGSSTGERRTSPFGPFKPYCCPANSVRERSGLPPMTHYVGISGVGLAAAMVPEKDPKAGFFGYDRKVRLSEVKDGTTTTILIAETATENGPWTAGGYPTVRGPDPENPPHTGRGAPFSSHHSGRHQGIVFVVMGDGFVRGIGPRTSPQVMEALCTIRGGETLPPDW